MVCDWLTGGRRARRCQSQWSRPSHTSHFLSRLIWVRRLFTSLLQRRTKTTAVALGTSCRVRGHTALYKWWCSGLTQVGGAFYSWLLLFQVRVIENQGLFENLVFILCSHSNSSLWSESNHKLKWCTGRSWNGCTLLVVQLLYCGDWNVVLLHFGPEQEVSCYLANWSTTRWI